MLSQYTHFLSIVAQGRWSLYHTTHSDPTLTASRVPLVIDREMTKGFQTRRRHDTLTVNRKGVPRGLCKKPTKQGYGEYRRMAYLQRYVESRRETQTPRVNSIKTSYIESTHSQARNI